MKVLTERNWYVLFSQITVVYRLFKSRGSDGFNYAEEQQWGASNVSTIYGSATKQVMSKVLHRNQFTCWLGGGGANKHPNRIWPTVAAMDLTTYEDRAWGDHGPLGTPPGSATGDSNLCLSLSHGFNGVKQILRFWANVTFSVANITFFSFGDYIFDSGITKSKFVRQSNVLPLKNVTFAQKCNIHPGFYNKTIPIQTMIQTQT